MATTPLIGFFGDAIPIESIMTLPMIASQAPRQATTLLDFFVARIPVTYYAILERPGLNALQAMVLTYHLLMKFPTPHDVGKVRGDQALAEHAMWSPLKTKN